MKCWLGLHRPLTVRVVEWRDGRMVVVVVVRCWMCGIRILEEVRPVAELQEPDHG